MKDLLEKLYPLNRNFCSDEYEKAISILQKELPFKKVVISSPKRHNGWELPPKWDLIEGKIFFRSKCIFSCDHPLKIIGLSQPFSGKVSLQELKKHLHFDHRFHDAIPYHFRQSYRPWDRTWGFCVSKDFFDSLEEGEYEVSIKTKESPGNLSVLEYCHSGLSPITFSFVAHLDHPGMANDDLAGVVVGVELFKQISKLSTKFSYKLVLLQEIIGSEFYLSQNDKQNLFEGLFLEMLGSKTPLSLQASRTAESCLEKALEETLIEKKIPFKKGPFKSIVCNDEIIWEAHGIPMASLSRFPYPEYHSSKDNPDIICPSALNEALDLLKHTISKIEMSTLIEKKFQGVPCLSHPDLSLYVDPGERAFGTEKNGVNTQLRALMDRIPTLDRPIFIEQLAVEFQLEKEEIREYLKKWEEKSLLKMT